MKKLLFAIVVLSSSALNAQKIIRKKIPDKLVVLTFDDAVKSHYSFVAPILRKYHFDATFFVCEFQPDFLDTSKYMTWGQIEQLSKWGFEIGNHTGHHQHVEKLKDDAMIGELNYINKKCDSLGIPKPVNFAYPGYGTRASAVPTLQKEGLVTARIGGDTVYNPLADNPFYIPSFSTTGTDKQRVLRFLEQAKNGNVVVLTIHGVPDLAHDWVTTPPELFDVYMAYLYEHNYKVISMKGLAKYIDFKAAAKLPLHVFNK